MRTLLLVYTSAYEFQLLLYFRLYQSPSQFKLIKPTIFGCDFGTKLLSLSKRVPKVVLKKKQSLFVNVVGLLKYKFILHIVTKVRGLRVITVRTEWRINIFHPQLHHTPPSRSGVGTLQIDKEFCAARQPL